MSKTSPIENLAPLAKAKIPLLHVSDIDDPWYNDHSLIAEKRYIDLGDKITTIKLDAHSLTTEAQAKIVDLMVSSVHPSRTISKTIVKRGINLRPC